MAQDYTDLYKRMDRSATRSEQAATAFGKVLTEDENTDVPVEGGTVPSMSKRIKQQLDASMGEIDQAVAAAQAAAQAAAAESTAVRNDLADPAKGAAMVAFKQEGDGSVNRTIQKKAADIINVRDFMTLQDVMDTASGKPSLGVREAVKKAVAKLNEVGGDLVFAPGHYNSPYLPHTDFANWIPITRSGVSFRASPGSVVMENFLFHAIGEYGAPQPVGSTGFTSGSKTINTAADHGLASGDYIQLLSGINAYSPDAGEWQLGSLNPTNLTTPICRHSEIHRVASADSSTTATLNSSVVYANYKNNTTGQQEPMPGITGAEVRKLNPIKGFSVHGITFRNYSNNFRTWIVRCAVDVVFEKCRFESGTLPGAHFKSTDVLNLSFLDCTSYRSPASASGSSWNTFLPGGGTQGVLFRGCKFYGEQQSVDITPNLMASDPGYSGDAIRAAYLTAQFFEIDGCIFHECSDGFTSHPGTYCLIASGNTFEGCSTGIRSRSRKTTIVGNNFRTFRAGVSLSAFYEDSIVADNNMEQLQSSPSMPWIGVTATPLSSEIMNGNNLKNVVVAGNSFRVTKSNAGNAGIQFRHDGNGVPANAGFTLFTDAIKTALSRYVVRDNTFVGCSAKVNRWINGVTFRDNHFSGGSDLSHYILCDYDSARHTLEGNVFADELAPGYSLANATNPLFPYNPSHAMGYQFGESNAVQGTADNTRGIFMTGASKPVIDHLRVGNGSGVSAVRVSGRSVLTLDAIPEDGTGNSEVRVFSGTTTTGTKSMSVRGRLSSESSYPSADNQFSSGLASNRWSVVYAASGSINTSDRDLKQQVRDLSDAEREVSRKVRGLIRAFKFNDAVQLKGEGARIHFGVMAQDVIAAFESEGLNPFDYAIVCYDDWPAEVDADGVEVIAAGSRYGIRYDELMAFIIACL